MQPPPPKPPVVVEIAGQRLRLAASADPQHLDRLAALVNERVEAIQKSTRGAGVPTLLALVCLDLADELHATRQRADAAKADAAAHRAELEARVREVEASARQSLADALQEIDRALVADEALAAQESVAAVAEPDDADPDDDD